MRKDRDRKSFLELATSFHLASVKLGAVLTEIEDITAEAHDLLGDNDDLQRIESGLYEARKGLLGMQTVLSDVEYTLVIESQKWIEPEYGPPPWW